MSEGANDITTLGLGLDSTGFVGGADAIASATDKVVAATEELIGAQEKLGEADKKAAQDGTEYFFHQSACTGVRFDELREGQSVSFEKGQGPKGPRAERVTLD